MPTDRSRPAYTFDVSWNGIHMSFAEVSGLTQEPATGDFRDAAARDRSAGRLPGFSKFSTITLKRGVADSRRWADWYAGSDSGTRQPRTLVITMLDEQQRPVTVWTVVNAFPMKIQGPSLDATGNDVAIESLELTHEGVELHNDHVGRAQRHLP